MAQLLLPEDPGALDACVQALRAGEPIIIPTDTVYGLAAAANNATAVARLFALKQRPLDLSIAALVADVDQARDHTHFDDSMVLAETFWPGALTLIATKLPTSDLAVGAADGTVGLRAPAHPFVRELARAVGPIAATSANLSGQPTMTVVDEMVATFGDAVAIVVDGGQLDGLASTVAKVTNNNDAGVTVTVFRDGAISEQDLRTHLT